MNKVTLSKSILTVLVALMSLFYINPVFAAREEIYVPPQGEVTAYPNILLLLDMSRSMKNSTGKGNNKDSRVNHMRRAVKSFIQANYPINLGIMAFPDGWGQDAINNENPGVSSNYLISDFIYLPKNKQKLLNLADQRIKYANLAFATPTPIAMMDAYGWFRSSYQNRLRRVKDGNKPTHGYHKNNRGTDITDSSPIEHGCQANHLIVLTDGKAKEGELPRAGKYVPFKGYSRNGKNHVPCAGSYGEGKCQVEMAEFWSPQEDSKYAGRARNDIRTNVPGTQTVKTHTINFSNDSIPTLRHISAAGEGIYRQGSNAESLVNAFSEIADQAIAEIKPSKYTAPSIPFDPSSGTNVNGEVYFNLFEPNSTHFWPGNLKKYRVGSLNRDGADKAGKLLDANGNLVYGSDNQINKNSLSIWSNRVDGSNITSGGAASKITRGNRNIWTYIDEPETTPSSLKNKKVVLNTNITEDNLQKLVSAVGDINHFAHAADIVTWLQGYQPQCVPNKIYNESACLNVMRNTSQGDLRQHMMAAPLNSTPVLLRYDNASRVLMNTTEGVLHAFDSESGSEKWAYIPQELLSSVTDIAKALPISFTSFTGLRHYGLDAEATLFHFDNGAKNPDKASDGIINAGEKAVLLLPMRDGGEMVYAFDVSTLDNPKFLWKTENNQLTYSWSKPTIGRFLDDSGNHRFYALFGGGHPDAKRSYNQAHNYPSPPTQQKGNAIIVVDVETGETRSITGFTDGITSQIVPLDFINETSNFMGYDNNGNRIPNDFLHDRAYVSDLGGNLYRVDFVDGKLNKTIVNKIATLSGNTAQEARRFYVEPDVSILGESVYLSIGSGNSNHPLKDTVTNDMFFSVKDPFPFQKVAESSNIHNQVTPITFAPPPKPIDAYTIDDLMDVTDRFANTKNSIKDLKGWYLKLLPGEKVVKPSVTAQGIVYFTSYEVTQTGSTRANPCKATQIEFNENSYLFIVRLENGAPVRVLSKEGISEKNGISTSAVSPDKYLRVDSNGITTGTTRSQLRKDRRIKLISGSFYKQVITTGSKITTGLSKTDEITEAIFDGNGDIIGSDSISNGSIIKYLGWNVIE